MNLSILHISDLHRDPANPIRNDVLLDSLENDRRNYLTEAPAVARPPDLILVSGDIVQGIQADDLGAESKLRLQYREALDFMNRLTDRFVGGDRSRVIIVPGNHDVSAYHAAKSLRVVDIQPDRKKALVAQLFSSGSPLRWSWSNLELLEITDSTVYDQRLAAFSEFYSEFYNGGRTYDLDPAKQVDVFDLPSFDLTIAGFSSCFNNDPMNKRGAIHPACIADAGARLRQTKYASRLRIAVWHHNIEGIPEHSDYMDPDVIQNLIERGFSLGFHGHQHRPQFLDTQFRYGPGRGIAVVSAGTLCGGASYRYGRSYNVIELDTVAKTGRLHVRETQNDNLHLPIWGRRALPPSVMPYYDFGFDAPPAPLILPDANTAALSEAQRLYEVRDYQGAAIVLRSVAVADPLAKPLLLDCLLKMKDMKALLETFDPPTSGAEAIHVMDALWFEGQHDRLKTVLCLSLVAESSDPSVAEMRKKYAARLAI